MIGTVPPWVAVRDHIIRAREEIVEARRHLGQLAECVHNSCTKADVIEPFMLALRKLENAEVDMESATDELEHDLIATGGAK